MANLTKALAGFVKRIIDNGFGNRYPTVKAAEADLYGGAIVGIDLSDPTAGIVHLTDAANRKAVGVFVGQKAEAGETNIEIATDGIFGPYTVTAGGLTVADEGKTVLYAGADDNHLVTAANSTYQVPVGILHQRLSETTCTVRISTAVMATTRKSIDITAAFKTQNGGTALAVFADGDSLIPGYSLDGSEGFGIRWNNKATHNQIEGSFLLPFDLDPSADATLELTVWKTGATVGDATTFIVGAYNNVVGSLVTADATYGGTTSAVTGAATSLTVQKVTLTLAAANLPAPGARVTMTIAPTAGTLGTDDITIGGAVIRYNGTGVG